MHRIALLCVSPKVRYGETSAPVHRCSTVRFEMGARGEMANEEEVPVSVKAAVLKEVKSSPEGCSPQELRNLLRERYDARAVQNAVVTLVSHGQVEVGPDWRMRASTK